MLNFLSWAVFFCSAFISLNCFAAPLVQTDFGAGYRLDSLNWNIGSPTGHPNVLSELSWKNLRMVNYHFQTTYNCPKKLYWRLTGDYGVIYQGFVRDSDWLEDNRSKEFSRTISNARRGEAFDIDLAFGYKRFCLFKRVSIIPLIGFSLQEQHLTMYNGYQFIGDIAPIEGLHSNYRARWYSPWIGFDFTSTLHQRLKLYGSFEGQISRYRGKGHWNLRDDFLDDFRHRAWGFGIVVKAGIKYCITPCISFSLFAQYQEHLASNGWDQIKTSDKDLGNITISQPLNNVRWYSTRAVALINYLW